jgi:hypothetical protein
MLSQKGSPENRVGGGKRRLVIAAALHALNHREPSNTFGARPGYFTGRGALMRRGALTGRGALMGRGDLIGAGDRIGRGLLIGAGGVTGRGRLKGASGGIGRFGDMTTVLNCWGIDR